MQCFHVLHSCTFSSLERDFIREPWRDGISSSAKILSHPEHQRSTSHDKGDIDFLLKGFLLN